MADHRIYIKHLYANFRDEGHQGVALKDKFWVATSTYTEGEFTAHMEQFKGMNKDAHEYLNKVDPSR